MFIKEKFERPISKRGSSISLNESLYKGPFFNPQLFDFFIKFPLYPIAITADNEKAYLQINVQKFIEIIFVFYGLMTYTVKIQSFNIIDSKEFYLAKAANNSS